MKPVLIAAAAAVAIVSASAAEVGASSPRARLRQFVCQRALDPPGRAVAVTAVMRPLPGTQKMALRFSLLSRTDPTRPVAPVTGGDLSTWISPANATLGQLPGDVWILKKHVADLAAPAPYRFQVSFRWTGAHGRLLGTALRDSPVCQQLELRPDLLVQSIAVQPIAGKPKLDRYVAIIRNGGATAAGPFEVLFSPGGTLPVKIRDLARLRPRTQVQEAFVGPVCSATSAPTITVDPNDQVDDYNRSNNSLTATCSTPSGT